VEATAPAILEFAAQRAKESWDERQQPYLLARLSPDLAREGVDYKSVLGEVRLKDFFQSAGDQIRLVIHPTQRTKIGLVPAGIEFEFAPAAAGAPSSGRSAEPMTDPLRASAARRRYIVSNFLGLLAELDDEDAAQVQIPTVVLTKLLRDK
jgi:hypothetical protein